MQATQKDIERFMKFVSPEALTGCWLWFGASDKYGYGRFGLGLDIVKAHRFSVAVLAGKEISGLLVCHHCDNPACVRPDHLFTGTAQDNTDDMFKKGRNPPRTKEVCIRGHRLSETQVIYESGYRQCRLCNNERAREKTAMNPVPRVYATHCGYGHEFTPENTYKPNGRGRACRECQKRISQEYEVRRKAKRQTEIKRRKELKNV
jgi:hypothetical protein